MQHQDELHSVLQQAFYRILKSLARVAISYGISAGAVTELVRRAFVDAAEAELHEQQNKPLYSRICTLTGLYRKEVVRIQALPPVGTSTIDDRYNRSTRVVTGWTQDRHFCTKSGKPAVLTMDGARGFMALVKRYSGDMTPRSMLEELTRLGVVEVTPQQRVRLLSRAYVPASSELDTLNILGTDTAELLDTIRHNIEATPETRRFQRKVEYVHIPQTHVDAFRQYAAKESQALLEKLDRWLARKDTEHISLGKPGSRLGVGIFQIESENSADSNSRPASTKEGTHDE